MVTITKSAKRFFEKRTGVIFSRTKMSHDEFKRLLKALAILDQ